MKKPLAILLIFSLLSPYFVSAQTDPCQDKEFLRLKDVNINDMTDREYKYFMMMSERCTGNEEKVQTATLQYPELDSTEKRAEFNRKRLTIKTKTTSSASGSAVELFDTGIFVGGARVLENAEWIPYRGFSTISVVEFLEVSGNEREANIIKDVASGSISPDMSEEGRNWWRGFIIATLGVILMSQGILDDTIFWWGVAFVGIGKIIIDNNPYQSRAEIKFEASSLQKVGYTNVFPITQAVQMAEGYNRQLWREMTNR